MTATGEEIIAKREAQYGGAWAKTGILLRLVAPELDQLLKEHAQMYLPYVTIVCKLMRILASPTNIDHWRDISGYAELVVRDLESDQKEIGNERRR